MKKLLLLLAMAGSVLAVYGEVLFVNGQSGYSIVLPASATPTEKFAAEELQTILKKSGNVTLPIVTSAGKKGSNIFIKTVPNGKKLEVRDEITIKYDNGDLILQGNKGYCALFAVYRFAERQLGFRWLYPGDAGEFFTPRNKFVLTPSVSEVFIPKIRFRSMFMVQRWVDIDCEKWILRNYGNVGLRSKEMRAKVDAPSFLVQHFGELRGKNAHLFKTHPEYFSLVNGERSIHGWGGCWTNPGYIDFFVNDVIDRMNRENYELLFIVAADMTIRCECAGCTAVKNRADRWINLFRIVYRRVKERFPDAMFGTCAYQDYRELPDGDIRFMDLPPSFSFSNRCYVHKINDKNCPHQAKALAEVNKWREKFGGDISLNCYENAIFLHFASYAPVMNMIIDQMKYFAELNPRVLRTEFPLAAKWVENANMKWNYEFQQYSLCRLNNYIFATMMHSPDVDTVKMMKEYCDTLYGPAGAVMYKYHTEMAKAWDSMDVHLVWYFHNAGPIAQKLLTPERIKKFNGYFAEAEKLVKSKPEYARYVKEVALDKLNYDLWVKYFNANSTASWELPLGKGLDKAAGFTMINREVDRDGKKLKLPGPPLQTTGTIARDDNFLYIHVDNLMESNYKLNRGIKNRDDIKLWFGDNVDILLRTNQQSDYFHIGINPAGGVYDARINDVSWNPVMDVKTKVYADRWTVDLKIPFNSLGYEGNPDGTEWSIGVNRYNSDGRAAGFPVPLFNQINATAKVKFDNNASPDKTVTFIVSEKPGTNLTLDLANCSWRVNKESFKEGWTKRSSGKEVLLLTPGKVKEAPKVFYQTRIESALENGSLVIFNDDSWTGWRYYFDDTFPQGYYRHKDMNPTETLYWVDSKSTEAEKKMIAGMIRTAGSSAYTPQEGWHILATEQLKNGKHVPVMMYKRHRNGMVALILGMRFIKKGHLGEFLEFLVKRWKAESAEWEKEARAENKVITAILPGQFDRFCVTPQFAAVPGWWINKESYMGNWLKKSTEKEVILITPGVAKEAPKTFYQNRILSALDNGSLVIFNDNGWFGWQNIFGNEFPKGYHRSGEIKPKQKLVWVDTLASAGEKKFAAQAFTVPGPFAYTATPGWHVLAQVQLQDGSYAPVMMYKKHRQGMIVLVLGMRYIKYGKVPEFTELLIRRWQQECK